jgi:hypothetical protein
VQLVAGRLGARGKNVETLECFFDALGPEDTSALKTVAMDIPAAYIDAVTSKAATSADRLRSLPRPEASAGSARQPPICGCPTAAQRMKAVTRGCHAWPNR